MSRQILVLLTLFVAEPTFAQRHLPVREGLSEAKITVTDGGGQSLVGASILLSGPTQRRLCRSHTASSSPIFHQGSIE